MLDKHRQLLKFRRFSLRSITEYDENFYCQVYGDKNLMRFIEFKQNDQQMRNGFRSILSSKKTLLFVIELSSGQRVGFTGLMLKKNEEYSAEFGIIILPEYRHKFIIIKVLKEVLDFGFNTVKLGSIYAYCEPTNLAAIKAAEHAGFKRMATLNDKKNGKEMIKWLIEPMR